MLKPLRYGSSTFDVITRYVCNAVLADVTTEDVQHPQLAEFAGAPSHRRDPVTNLLALPSPVQLKRLPKWERGGGGASGD